MLIADDAASIDDEGLGDAGGAERELDAAVVVEADPLIGIAVLGEEAGDILRPVANRHGVDRKAPAGERLEMRRFGDARDAPAGEDVEDARAPGGEARPRDRRPARQRRRKRELGERAADQLRADRPVRRRAQIDCGEHDEEDEGGERHPEDEALHA
jgi:hypothetical protein